MGWKNVKEHYGIKHIVQITDAGICIGSEYCHNLIVIGKDLIPTRPSSYLGKGDPFDGWIAAMTADSVTLQRLIEDPDTFSRSLPVFTYDDKTGEIIEKQCEEYGWPHITHDGMIQDSMFSPDRNKVAARAKRRENAAIENFQRSIVTQERELAQTREHLARFEDNLKKLDRDFPDIAALSCRDDE